MDDPEEVQRRTQRSERIRSEELEEVRRRVAEKAAGAQRTKLHSFGLAGGRRIPREK